MGLLSSAAHPIRTQFRGGEIICGRMTTAGAADPTKVAPAVGWTAVRLGTGQIKITLPRAYKKVLYATADLIVAAASTKQAQIIATTDGGVRTGATVTIEMQNTLGTAADQTGLDLCFFVVAAQVK